MSDDMSVDEYNRPLAVNILIFDTFPHEPSNPFFQPPESCVPQRPQGDAHQPSTDILLTPDMLVTSLPCPTCIAATVGTIE